MEGRERKRALRRGRTAERMRRTDEKSNRRENGRTPGGESPGLPWPGFAVVLAALFCLDPRGLFPAVGCAVLVHEAGHLLALGLLGSGRVQLELSGRGAVLHTGLVSWPRQLVCDLAGPAAGLAYALAVENLWPLGGAVSQLISCWNLLPVLPLDGGQAVQAALLGLGPGSWQARYEQLQWPLALASVPAALYLALVRNVGVLPLLLAAVLVCNRAREAWRQETGPAAGSGR